MDTVKINSNQNIVEKSFTYQELYDIFSMQFFVNLREYGQTNYVTQYGYLISPPIVTIDNLPADFEDYKYIYINAPFLDFFNNSDTPFNFALSFSMDRTTKQLFTGNGYNANDDSKTSEQFTLINNILTNTFDIATNKQQILPLSLSNVRKIYVQIPSPLIIYALTNQAGLINVNTGLHKISPQLPIYPTTDYHPNKVIAQNNREIGLTKAVRTQQYSTPLSSENIWWCQPFPYFMATPLDFSAIKGKVYEKYGITPDVFEKGFRDFVLDPYNNGRNIDFNNNTNEYVTFTGTPDTRHANDFPLSGTDTPDISINSNQTFMENKLINIYFAKQPMGI